jgi:hypothetical protein
MAFFFVPLKVENLIAQLIKKFPVFQGTRRIIKVHGYTPMNPTLSHPDPIHTHAPQLFNINFNITLKSKGAGIAQSV